jgi:hypothetical protein
MSIFRIAVSMPDNLVGSVTGPYIPWIGYICKIIPLNKNSTPTCKLVSCAAATHLRTPRYIHSTGYCASRYCTREGRRTGRRDLVQCSMTATDTLSHFTADSVGL